MRGNRAKKTSDAWKIVIISITSLLIIGAIVFTVKEKQELIKPSLKPPVEEQSNENNNSTEVPAETDVQEENEDKNDEKLNENQQEQQTEQKDEPKSIEYDESGYPVTHIEPVEPTYVKGILVANKQYPLPKTYNPGESPESKAALGKMLAGAKEAGFDLTAFSGFRSYEYQTTLYTNYVNRDGKKAADRYSARPGYSEHQTGLAYDIGEKGRENLWLTSEFGETTAGKWLHQHAHEYGFILRYPQGKENITGYMYESWHFRYVGLEIAKAVYEANTTLEEYLGLK
ncbi:D-alanyl-D-alanine carboxypeptidase family protein [Bacillus ndiopicus]|uniref:D-alanyl-D-alanine carboxypeptidase family protein n=1 Tax=Bacillus ndiopicus TaxID=1347368 RepID=UPI0005A65BEC|nr:D-alanyl-D-alanine carboxypeptidase family protein [Bacillus ndiopicus]